MTTHQSSNHNHHNHHHQHHNSHHHQHHNNNHVSSSRQKKNNNGNSKSHSVDKTKNIILNDGNLNSASFNAQAFDLPTVTTNGMKNIEHFIDKALVDGKQWYRCKWQNCTYATIRSDSIVRHMRKHTGERPYKCWFCSYATIQSSALKIHMRRHTGEKPYICKYQNCGKRFAVLNTLVVHERTHTGYKPFKCSINDNCNYSSSDRCKLVNHIRKTHQMNIDAKASNSINQSNHQATESSTIFPLANGSSVQPNSSGHSLALVSGAMSSSQFANLASSVYNPFAQIQSNNHQMMVNNLTNSEHLKAAPAAHAASQFVPLNLLSVISGAGNYETLQNTNTDIYTTATETTGQHQKNHKNRKSIPTASNRKAKLKKNNNGDESLAMTLKLTNGVTREDNSIKRVMILVDKRIVNNRTSYICKWPSCGYESLRSDCIVRHIRSHTGERPYKCHYDSCTYAAIQRSSLNKHLMRHQQNIF